MYRYLLLWIIEIKPPDLPRHKLKCLIGITEMLYYLVITFLPHVNDRRIHIFIFSIMFPLILLAGILSIYYLFITKCLCKICRDYTPPCQKKNIRRPLTPLPPYWKPNTWTAPMQDLKIFCHTNSMSKNYHTHFLNSLAIRW